MENPHTCRGGAGSRRLLSSLQFLVCLGYGANRFVHLQKPKVPHAAIYSRGRF